MRAKKGKLMGEDISDQDLVDAEARGLSHGEMAGAFGMSESMVRTRLRRARTRGMKPTDLDEEREKYAQLFERDGAETEWLDGYNEDMPSNQLMDALQRSEPEPEPEPEPAQESEPTHSAEWTTAKVLAGAVGMSREQFRQRHRSGGMVDGRRIERREALNPTHSRQQWEYRLVEVVDAPEQAEGSTAMRAEAAAVRAVGDAVTAATSALGEAAVVREHTGIDYEAAYFDETERRARAEAARLEMGEKLADALSERDVLKENLDAAIKKNSLLQECADREIAHRKEVLREAAKIREELGNTQLELAQVKRERDELRAHVDAELVEAQFASVPPAGEGVHLTLAQWATLASVQGMCTALLFARSEHTRTIAGVMDELLSSVIDRGDQ